MNTGIPLSEFQTLALALPRCVITQPNDAGASWILDHEGNRVGSVQWKTAIITIFNEYEYAEDVIERIGKEKFTDRTPEFDGKDIAKNMYE